MRRILCLFAVLSWTACAPDAHEAEPGDFSNGRATPGTSGPQQGAPNEQVATPATSDTTAPATDAGATAPTADAGAPAAPRAGIGDGETGSRPVGSSFGGGATVGGLGGFAGGFSAPSAGAPVVGPGGVAGAGGGVVGGSPGGAGAGGLLAGLAGGGGVMGGGAVGSGAGDGTSTSGGSSTGAPPPASSGPTYESGAINTQPQAGQLTVGAWDDNLNYERFGKFRQAQSAKQLPGLLPFNAADFDAAHARFPAARAAHQQLDVALVIDTTGSMGDEIRYLQSEFIALSSAIEAAYPDAEQRWALVLYRDVGDEYVTRYFDFRDDPQAFRDKLALQSSSGGGDFPEAPEAAFEIMNQFAWRQGAGVARLAFWVADAPHHAENASKLAQGIRTAQEQDIHVYPVASSGIDEFTELGMRSAAQLTGGRYLFLTDDSGIGGAHLEPSIPCYFVTLLKHAILRMVEIEMSGRYREPEDSQVIRTGGDPEDGACTLASGEVVVLF
jgi:hypothetical protein